MPEALDEPLTSPLLLIVGVDLQASDRDDDLSSSMTLR
jgi:hypothetical protein